MPDDLDAYLDPAPKPRRNNYDEIINRHAQRTGLDPSLIKAVMGQESGGNPNAVSPKGARGPMQLMPATAKRFGVTSPHDPEQAVRGGTDYLKFLNDRYQGNRDLVLAGYNAGEGNVDKFHGVPPFKETRNYVRSINRKLGQQQTAGDLDAYLDPTPTPTPRTVTPSVTDALDKLATDVNRRTARIKPQSPFAGVRAGAKGQSTQTIDAGEGYSQPTGLINGPSAPAMQARHPGIVERVTEAVKPYVPGLTSLDTPMGIKTDPIRGAIRGATLGIAGDSREITPEERLVNPEAEQQRNFAEGAGEMLGAVVPYVGVGKALGAIPALNRATRAAHIARTAATFGGVDLAKQGVEAVKSGKPVDLKEAAISTLMGGSMGAIAGVDPSMKRQVVAFLAPQVAVDVAKGTPIEQAIPNALTTLGFALTSGAGGKREWKPTSMFRGPSVPEATQAKLANAERINDARQAETQRQSGIPADELNRQSRESSANTRDVGARERAVTPTTEAASVGNQPVPAQRFHSLRFGDVEVTESQEGARAGKLRVAEVGNPEAIHYVKKADMQGRGNAQLLPIRETPSAESTPSGSSAPLLQRGQLSPKTSVPQSPVEAVPPITPQEMNFTQFANSRGLASDYDVLDHSDLSPSGSVSNRARKAAQGRQADRADQNAQAHQEFEAAIRSGEIVDSEPSAYRRVTKEKLETADKAAADKELASQLNSIDSQIRTIENLGPMSHLPNGKLKAKYQRTVDLYNQKKAKLLSATPTPEAVPTASPESQSEVVSPARQAASQTEDIGEAGKDPAVRKGETLPKERDTFWQGQGATAFRFPDGAKVVGYYDGGQFDIRSMSVPQEREGRGSQILALLRKRFPRIVVNEITNEALPFWRKAQERGLVDRLQTDADLKPIQPSPSENFDQVGKELAGPERQSVEPSAPPQKVRIAGAEFDLVREHPDGTATVRNAEGSEFNTAPNEVYTKLSTAQPKQPEPLPATKNEFVRQELAKQRATREQVVQDVVDSINREYKPRMTLPVGVSKLQSLLTKPRRSQSTRERHLLAQYENARNALTVDTTLDAEKYSAVYDRLRGAPSSTSGVLTNPERGTRAGGEPEKAVSSFPQGEVVKENQPVNEAQPSQLSPAESRQLDRPAIAGEELSGMAKDKRAGQPTPLAENASAPQVGKKLPSDFVYHNLKGESLDAIRAEGFNQGSFSNKPIDFGGDTWLAVRKTDLPNVQEHQYGAVRAYEPSFENAPSIPADRIYLVDSKGRVTRSLAEQSKTEATRNEAVSEQPSSSKVASPLTLTAEKPSLPIPELRYGKAQLTRKEIAAVLSGPAKHDTEQVRAAYEARQAENQRWRASKYHTETGEPYVKANPQEQAARIARREQAANIGAESATKEPWETTKAQYQETADGSAYSDALNNRVRPAPPQEVARIKGLEDAKHVLRSRIREGFPATKTWKYETSWGQDLSNSHRAFVEKALREGKPVPESVLKDYPELRKETPNAAITKAADLETQQSGKDVGGGTTETIPPTPSRTSARRTPDNQTSRLALGVEAKAIEAKLTEGFQGLPEYETVRVKDQAENATKLLRSDPAKATRIALGKEVPPADLLPESVFVAVENQALKDGNIDLLRDLATASTLPTEATGMGQRIRMLAERNPNSAVSAIREVQLAREAKAERTHGDLRKAKNKIKTEIHAEVKKSLPKARDWASFLETIKC